MTEVIQTFWSAFMAGGLLSIGFVFFSAVNWYWVIRCWNVFNLRSQMKMFV